MGDEPKQKVWQLRPELVAERERRKQAARAAAAATRAIMREDLAVFEAMDPEEIRGIQVLALGAVERHGTIRAAAAAAGISRHTLKGMLRRDENFSKEWEEAKESFAEDIEETVFDRVKNGTDSNKYYDTKLTLATLASMKESWRPHSRIDVAAADVTEVARKLEEGRERALKAQEGKADGKAVEG